MAVSAAEASYVSGRDTSAEAEEIRESLTCGICSDILYDCVSAQPCLHSFCGGCVSEWIRRSAICPTCRRPVETLAVNHRLNGVVESYLKHHPDEIRDEAERADLDRRNDVKSSGGVLDVDKNVKKAYDSDSTDGGSVSNSGGTTANSDGGFGFGWLAGAAVLGAAAGGLAMALLRNDDKKKNGRNSD